MNCTFYKIIWCLVNIAVDLFEIIYYFGLEFRENAENYIKKARREHVRDKKLMIEESVRVLEKLPRHIAVILVAESEKDVDLSRLTDLIFWALHTKGVDFISFYDSRGILKHRLASSFHDTIKKQLQISDNVVWGPNFQKLSTFENVQFPHKNGYKNHIVVNLYSSQDSYEPFNQLLTKELWTENKSVICNSKEVSVSFIEEKLDKLYLHLPDPELAVYFGNFTCTTGFLPWHLRLTEFMQVSNKIHQLSLEKYLNVLYKYAKCEQRYGK